MSHNLAIACDAMAGDALSGDVPITEVAALIDAWDLVGFREPQGPWVLSGRGAGVALPIHLGSRRPGPVAAIRAVATWSTQ